MGKCGPHNTHLKSSLPPFPNFGSQKLDNRLPLQKRSHTPPPNPTCYWLTQRNKPMGHFRGGQMKEIKRDPPRGGGSKKIAQKKDPRKFSLAYGRAPPLGGVPAGPNHPPPGGWGSDLKKKTATLLLLYVSQKGKHNRSNGRGTTDLFISAALPAALPVAGNSGNGKKTAPWSGRERSLDSAGYGSSSTENTMIFRQHNELPGGKN